MDIRVSKRHPDTSLAKGLPPPPSQAYTTHGLEDHHVTSMYTPHGKCSLQIVQIAPIHEVGLEGGVTAVCTEVCQNHSQDADHYAPQSS